MDGGIRLEDNKDNLYRDSSRRSFFRNSMSRSLRYPIRTSRKTAPKNIVTSLPKKGHFASTPSLTIGSKARGVCGEYIYTIEGPADPPPLPVSFYPPFKASNPTKKIHGSGTNEGLFQAPTYEIQGVKPRSKTFEATGNRMIAQSLYPLQVFPTAVTFT
mmetsp:Transcript_42646/g.134285  ORF Transcript_42646/g.134285 Transcript_42646/m.134285 type:complete len:159 (+) Transcript_42646:536-1012(+)